MDPSRLRVHAGRELLDVRVAEFLQFPVGGEPAGELVVGGKLPQHERIGGRAGFSPLQHRELQPPVEDLPHLGGRVGVERPTGQEEKRVAHVGKQDLELLPLFLERVHVEEDPAALHRPQDLDQRDLDLVE